MNPRGPDDRPPGSLLGLIRTRHPWIVVEPFEEREADDFWPQGQRPAWVSDSGKDGIVGSQFSKVSRLEQKVRGARPA